MIPSNDYIFKCLKPTLSTVFHNETLDIKKNQIWYHDSSLTGFWKYLLIWLGKHMKKSVNIRKEEAK